MNCVVVITGASAGIGRSLALSYAKRGARVVLFARRLEALRAVAAEVERCGGKAHVVAGDVTRDDDVARLIKETHTTFGRLDVLVNNAGRGYYTTIREVEPQKLLSLFELNVVAPIRVTQKALSLLLASQGAVVMVSSVAGVASTPRVGAYAATKFALEAVSQALRAELADSGVRVLVVRPGPVVTAFRQNAARGPKDPGFPDDDQRQEVDDVAERIVKAVENHESVLETSSFVKASSLLARLAPSVFRKVGVRMARRYGL